MTQIRAVIAIVVTAVAVRLIAMTSLHPLGWDEIEFFRATDWVRQGLVPFRDFWEHHTPLQWFVFAPFAAVIRSEGAAAIIAMRWAQVLLWVVTFWIANRLMIAVGATRFARWAAIAITVCSSLLMLPAMEYRVDVLGCALYLAGLLLLVDTRGRAPLHSSEFRVLSSELSSGGGRNSELRTRHSELFLAGVFFCLAGLANLRLGPLLAMTAILALFVDTDERRWRFRRRMVSLYAGVVTALGAAALYGAATGSLSLLYRYVWVENYLGDRYATPVASAFPHRLLVTFGIRVIRRPDDSWFQLSGVDLPGAALLVIGVVGMARALLRWRNPDSLFLMAVLQIMNVLFIARMVFVYNYHFEIVALMMLPFVAVELARITERSFRAPESARNLGGESAHLPDSSPSARPGMTVTLALLGVFWILNAGFALLRGKEGDLAYQDVIMREVHARTPPGAKVFDGVGWALRRQPAYQRWFLPELVRELVKHGHIAPYRLSDWLADPPAAVITDRNAAVFLARNPELGIHAVRHYLPLWRNLWLPAMSGQLQPGHAAEWIVPATGRYRVFASPALASDPWFRDPLAYGVARPPLRFGGTPEAVLEVWANGQPVKHAPLSLQRGDRLRVRSQGERSIGLFLVPGDETVWFRQPPPQVTLDGEAARVTHLPRPYNVFSARTPTWSVQP